MNRAHLRLGVTAALFFLWLGWLAYLALVKPRPTVVSRSQVMAATHAVVATVQLNDAGRPAALVVQEVVAGPEPRQGFELGATIQPANLGHATFVGGPPATGPSYLVLLARERNGVVIAAAPSSPGHPRRGDPLIYPWTPEVRQQLQELWH